MWRSCIEQLEDTDGGNSTRSHVHDVWCDAWKALSFAQRQTNRQPPQHTKDRVATAHGGGRRGALECQAALKRQLAPQRTTVQRGGVWL